MSWNAASDGGRVLSAHSSAVRVHSELARTEPVSYARPSYLYTIHICIRYEADFGALHAAFPVHAWLHGERVVKNPPLRSPLRAVFPNRIAIETLQTHAHPDCATYCNGARAKSGKCCVLPWNRFAWCTVSQAILLLPPAGSGFAV